MEASKPFRYFSATQPSRWSAILRLRNRQFHCFFLLCPKRSSPFFYTYPTKNLLL